ncbi:MAG: hypothetical protein Q9157_002791 [Trypethelium eluteriae]
MPTSPSSTVAAPVTGDSLQVIVLVTSTEEIYLEDKGYANQYSSTDTFQGIVMLPRAPWTTEVDITLNSGQVHGTLKLSRLGHGMAWKRLIGAIREVWIFQDSPKRSDKASRVGRFLPQ